MWLPYKIVACVNDACNDAEHFLHSDIRNRPTVKKTRLYYCCHAKRRSTSTRMALDRRLNSMDRANTTSRSNKSSSPSRKLTRGCHTSVINGDHPVTIEFPIIIWDFCYNKNDTVLGITCFCNLPSSLAFPGTVWNALTSFAYSLSLVICSLAHLYYNSP